MTLLFSLFLFTVLHNTLPIHAVDTQLRDNSVCDLVYNTNIKNMKGLPGWEGWECTGSSGNYTANNLCELFWTGVLCRGDNITEIILGNKGIAGTIPQSIGNLTDLIWIDFTLNFLSGTLPDSISELSNLLEITVAENSLTGSIPDSIGSLKSLINLDMSENSIHGNLPSTIGQLSNLQYLTIAQTNLSGTIPSEIGLLSSLAYVELYENQLTGTLPETLGNNRKLETLQLQSNSFTGSIPSSFGQLTELQMLNLQMNSLTGTLPSSLQSLGKLRVLRAYGNNISADGVEYLCESIPRIRIIELEPHINACTKDDDVTIEPDDPTCCTPESSVFSLIIVASVMCCCLATWCVCSYKTSPDDYLTADEDFVVENKLHTLSTGAQQGENAGRNNASTLTSMYVIHDEEDDSEHEADEYQEGDIEMKGDSPVDAY